MMKRTILFLENIQKLMILKLKQFFYSLKEFIEKENNMYDKYPNLNTLQAKINKIIKKEIE